MLTEQQVRMKCVELAYSKCQTADEAILHAVESATWVLEGKTPEQQMAECHTKQ